MTRESNGLSGGIVPLMMERISELAATQERTAGVLDGAIQRLAKLETELPLRVVTAEKDHDEFRAAIANLERLVQDHHTRILPLETILSQGKWLLGGGILSIAALIGMLWWLGFVLTHKGIP
jgi:hypothetical protein